MTDEEFEELREDIKRIREQVEILASAVENNRIKIKARSSKTHTIKMGVGVVWRVTQEEYDALKAIKVSKRMAVLEQLRQR